jgi:hypothetical protein
MLSILVVPLGFAAHTSLAKAVPDASVASRIGGAPCLTDRRKETLRQLFGDNFRDAEERELRRVTKVEQPRPADPQPEWMEAAPGAAAPREWRAQRLQLWLEDRGVNLEKVLVVSEAGGQQLALVTATDVAAGTALFDIPDSLLLTADVAFADPDIGRSLRDMSTRRRGPSGAGFDTFAIAASLAAERVRRGAVRGRLRRQDGGLQIGALSFETEGARGQLLPDWAVEEMRDLQTNLPFSPFIASLPWSADLLDECAVDTEDRAGAIQDGASLIARLIEPVARNAWMKTTQGLQSGLAQSTSDEDVGCRATEALLLAIQTQLEPPPPIGEPEGARGWGGNARDGPALVPMANLVLPPTESAAAEARERRSFNAQLGRPRPRRADSALRCVASRDLPAGTLIVSDVPGSLGPAPQLVPRARVRVLQEGPLVDTVGTALTPRPKDGRWMVRLEGGDGDGKLVALAAEELQPIGGGAAKPDAAAQTAQCEGDDDEGSGRRSRRRATL